MQTSNEAAGTGVLKTESSARLLPALKPKVATNSTSSYTAGKEILKSPPKQKLNPKIPENFDKKLKSSMEKSENLKRKDTENNVREVEKQGNKAKSARVRKFLIFQ